MNGHAFEPTRKKLAGCTLLLFLLAPQLLAGEPTPAATSAFDAYAETVERRIDRQHKSKAAFLAPAARDAENADQRLRRGELIIERLTPASGPDLPGALLHHWRGTAFAPRANAADFGRLLRDFSSYPQYFAPQVLQARTLTNGEDRIQGYMRVRQWHVITVDMDMTCEITFGQLDPQHGYSVSHGMRIAEVDSSEDHGFLWGLNTWWSYEERDGGLYLQIESLSLTRSIPAGLGWLIRPYVESIPRESLEFTLQSARRAISPPA